MSEDEYQFSSCDEDPVDLLKRSLQQGTRDEGIVRDLKLCVRHGDWDACSWLALCYRIGYCVQRDAFVSEMLLQLSSINGSEEMDNVLLFAKQHEDSFGSDSGQTDATSVSERVCPCGPEDYTVIDIETTGLSPYEDDLTELAALRVRGGVAVEWFQELVRTDRRIPDIVARKTHIDNEMLIGARPAREVLSDFLDFIGDDILVGYNINRFDIEFIAAKARSELFREIHVHTIDVLWLAKRKLEGIGAFSLDNLRRVFGIDGEGAHRALRDCQDTNAIYQKICSLPDRPRTNAAWSCASAESREAQLEAARQRDAECLNRVAELFSLVPESFSPVFKPEIPTHYKERWAYVAEHPFKTFASSILSITGDSQLVPRIVAEELVVRLGAKLKATTTRDCDFCVVLCDEGTGKKAAAEKWQAQGSTLRIIGPEEFLEMVKLSVVEKS